MFTANYESKLVPATLALVALLGLPQPAMLRADSRPQLQTPRLLPVNMRIEAERICPAVWPATPNELWRVIDQHDNGQLESAVAGWRQVTVAEDQRVWKHLGLGVAYLHSGQLSDAEKELAIAERLAAKNAPVHYFIGLLAMERAAVDLAADGDFRSRQDYRSAAIRELTLAIRYAPSTYLDTPLGPTWDVVNVPYPLPEPTKPPTAANLLEALGADNFVGKSHALLADLYIDQGRPHQAEHHVDEAAVLGISVPYGYRRIAVSFEEEGHASDALRAFQKARDGGDQLANYGRSPVQQLGSALSELIRYRDGAPEAPDMKVDLLELPIASRYPTRPQGL